MRWLAVLALFVLGAVLMLAAGGRGQESPDQAAELAAQNARLRVQLGRERDRSRVMVRALWSENRRLVGIGHRALAAPSVRLAFRLAHVVYGVPEAGLSRLAYCESRHRPWARNATPLGGSHASGLTQILYPSTWRTTPYGHLSPYDAVTSALAAGHIWRRAGGSFREWADVCAQVGDG